MKRSLSGIVATALAVALIGSAGTAAQELVINEIMQNPAAVSDSSGEWFELYNPGASAVDINGWTIADSGVDSHVIANGGPLLVPAGSFVVLGNNGDAATNGGVAVDYVYGSSFFLANGDDELVLSDLALVEVDRVEWDGGPVFPDPNGASMALIAPTLDNNNGANWCESSTPFGAGDFGTPGAANDCGGAPIVINEFVANHTGSDTHEFVEILGAPATDYSALTLLEIEGDSTGAGTIDGVFPVGTTDASGYWTTGFLANAIENGSVTLLLVEGFSGLEGDDLDLDDDGALDVMPWTLMLDDVAVSDGGTGDRTYGVTLMPGYDGISFTVGGASRIPNGADTDSAADWVRNDFDGAGLPGFTGTPDPGDALNTPDAENEVVAAPAADPLINEFVFNHTGSDTHEFVEVFGDPNADYSAFTVLEIEGDGSGAGTIDGVFPVGTTDASGYWTTGFLANVIENGSVTLLLVENFTGSAGDDLDIDNDGVLDATPWTRLLDDVAVSDGGSTDWTYGLTLVPGYDGISFTVGGASRIPNGVDTDSAADWVRNDFDGAGLPGFTGSIDPGEALNTPGFANRLPSLVVINEIDYDQPGTDNAEFIEIKNISGEALDLAGFELQLVNGSDVVVYATIPLSGTLAADDYFVVCGDAANVANCDLVASPSTNLIQNGSPDAIVLTRGAAILDAVTYEGDLGPPYTEGSGAGLEDSSSEQNAGISRLPDGADTDRNNVDFGFSCITPGLANSPLLVNCGPTGATAEIYEIQGAGDASPFDGAVITTSDNVVTGIAPNGFFIQTPTGRTDGDVDTSDGIFVFTGGAPAVAVGDLVDVTGEVDEFFGFTEFGFGSTVTVVGSGALPAPVSFNAAVPSPDPAFPSCALEYECYEGMLVEIVEGTVTGPNQRFTPDPVAEVHITATSMRAFREPGIEYPGVSGYPLWDGNPEVFELDPDKLGLPNEIIPAGSTFSAVGFLGFEFGGYELWPLSLTVDPASLPEPVRAREPGELTVGSLNLFRFFDDVDDPVDADGRNDSVVSTADYLRRRAKFTSYVLDVLYAPDVLAVQEAEKLEVLEMLAADIATVDPSVLYSAHLVEGNDVGTIDVGFLVRDHVAVDAITQLGKDELFAFDNPPSPLHDRPPLLLEGRSLLEFGSYPISVMVVHNRSLGGIETERVQRKRLAQAESIAQKVQDLQSANPQVRLVVIGDFNAFEFTDGYLDAVGVIAGEFEPADSLICASVPCLDLVEPNLTNLTPVIEQPERYSFIFRGSAQVLDHALITQPLAAEITGVEFGRGNADAAFDLINDDGSVDPLNLPLRSSDHDGLVVFIEQDEDADGVPNDLDVCPGTVIPEGVPVGALGVNRFALVDGDGVFDTVERGRGGGPSASFDLGDTAGCSCEQIIVEAGLGSGHVKYGCSQSAMLSWVEMVSQ